MQSIRKMLFVGAALAASSTAAMAHEEGGWAAIHWHATDVLGLAVVGALAIAAVWLARPPRRGARRKTRSGEE